MTTYPECLKRVRAFVSGETPAREFEQQVYGDPEMEALLSQEDAPKFCRTGTTLFHYLIGIDYDSPGDVLDVQHVLVEFLARHGVPTKPAAGPLNEFRLLLDAQPRWLDADMKYLASRLAPAPPSSPKEQKAWLRQRILELFRYVKSPPRWLQSPAWPIGDSGPLVFLGQFAVSDYFHDNAVVYVFHDPATNECRSVVQVA